MGRRKPAAIAAALAVPALGVVPAALGQSNGNGGIGPPDAAKAGALAPMAMTGTAHAAPLAMVLRLGRRTSIPCD